MSIRDSDKPREKKSWREIDKGRDNSQARRDREDRERNQNAITGDKTAYDKYKKNLEKMWNTGQAFQVLEEKRQEVSGGAPPPDEPAGEKRAVIRPPSEDVKKEREARTALLKAITPMEVKTAAAALLAIRPTLPDELELLSKVLSSPSEAHQVAALRLLDARSDLATNPSARLFKGRLQTVLLTASDDETKTLAQSVKSKLA